MTHTFTVGSASGDTLLGVLIVAAGVLALLAPDVLRWVFKHRGG